MKKLIALALIVIISISVVACNNQPDNTTTTTTTTTTTSSTTSSSENSDPVVDPDPTTETVYVNTESLYIRKTPEALDDLSNLLKSVYYGDTLVRVAEADGWSTVLVDGEHYYVSSAYVTTKKIITAFEKCEETVYIVGLESINIRAKADLESQIVTSLNRGDSLKRTGVAEEADDEGITWSRVEVTVKDANNQDTIKEGYINSKYVSTTPDEDEPVPETDVTFKDQQDTLVVLADSINLRTYPKYEEGSLSGKTASKGDELTRTKIAEAADADGIVWSEVVIDGTKYYISSNPAYTQVKE